MRRTFQCLRSRKLSLVSLNLPRVSGISRFSQPLKLNKMIFHASTLTYCCCSNVDAQIFSDSRIRTSSTPNPLSHMFQGPRFLEQNQIIEVRSEKEAFHYSQFLHELFVASRSINKVEMSSSCCGSSKNQGNEKSCCSSKGGPEKPVSLNTLLDDSKAPIRSIYSNEKTLTVNLSENYVLERFSCEKEDTEMFDLCTKAVWKSLLPILTQVMQKHIAIEDKSDRSDEYTGLIRILDPKGDNTEEENSAPSMWSSANEDTEITMNDSEPVMAVKELIRLRVKPILEQDGGSCRFIGMVEDENSEYNTVLASHPHIVEPDPAADPFNLKKLSTGSVLVMLEGACVGCPSSSFTLKNSIQRMLMHWVPEVSQVIEVDEKYVRDLFDERKKKETA